MNAIELARQAYAPTSFPLKSERAIEAQLIGQITARLKAAAKKADTDFPAFAEALHANRLLWVRLAVDVADRDNGLSKELRAQIFYLASFTELHSDKVLRRDATAEALIDINTAVLRGLNAGKGS